MSEPDNVNPDSPASPAVEVRHFIGGEGIILADDVFGREGDPAVILLHGGGQTRRSWGNGALALAAAGYRVIAYDARGHGQSGWSPSGDYGIAAMVDDLRRIVQLLPEPPALVGASLGGLSALHLVGFDHGVSARALVLVDVAPTISEQGSARIAAFMRARPDGYASIDEVADAVAAYNPHRPRPADLEGLRHNLREVDGRLFWHWDPAFLNSRRFEPAMFRERSEAAARATMIPVLLVRGGSSDLITQADVDHFRELNPAAEFCEVAGAGHMVAGDRNDAFNAIIVEFLRRVDEG